MAPGGGVLTRDKPPRQPLRSCVRKQTRYGPNKSHATTKRVSINPESPCFLVFHSVTTPDLFFADPSTTRSPNSEDADPMVQEAPLSSLSLGSITGPTANCVKLPPTEGPTANTCEGAEGPRQLRLLQEIENLSMGELKDKIREVWPRHPSRSTAHSDDPLRLTPSLPSLQVTMKRRQRQRRLLRTAPVSSTHRTTSPEVASPASSPEAALRSFPEAVSTGDGFSSLSQA